MPKELGRKLKRLTKKKNLPSLKEKIILSLAKMLSAYLFKHKWHYLLLIAETNDDPIEAKNPFHYYGWYGYADQIVATVKIGLGSYAKLKCGGAYKKKANFPTNPNPKRPIWGKKGKCK